MPDKKITDLTELTTPVSTDVLAIVDVAANITKKIQVGNLPGGSGGGVTDVTGTAPITSTRGTTPDIGITNATPSADGAMSAADKTKLDGIAAGAEVNVQSDWTEANSAADSFILNKPTLTNGTVTGVLGTAPISSDGNSVTPTISIAAATDTAAGSMSAADKAKLDDIDITTPAAGEVLIYDSVAGVFENATLTAGSGVTITEGEGSITIAAPGGGAGVSSVEGLTGALILNGAGTVAVTDNGSETITITGSGATDLDDLTDVTITGTPGAGEILINNATTGQFVNATLTAGTNVTITEADGSVTIASTGGGAADLDDLTDVTITGTPTAGEILINNATTGQFVNSTLTAGANVTITEADGSITIAATGGGGGLAAVVDDTSPQLGGNLDVFDGTTAHIITTTQTNGNIAITPDGTGVVQLDGLSYPTADGTVANQPMVTDASGQLSFSGTVTANVAGQEINFNAGTATLSTAGDAEGTVVYFGTGGTAAGKVYTFFTGAWVAVDASVGGENTTKGLLAMALGTTPATDGMLIQGIGVLDHNPGSAGDILFVTTGTAGELTATQPSATDEYSRVVGHQIGASKVLFTPSQDWIKIA